LAANFIINITGRGVHYCGLASNAELEPLCATLNTSLHQGFEVYIYSIEPSPAGHNQHFPTSVLTLKRQYHLYAAHDEYKQEAHDIIERLSAHSKAASSEYLTIMISEFQRELAVLKEDNHTDEKGNVPQSQREVAQDTKAEGSV
jgi:hypothetical protein